jgi:REP element-mobilizing transposase RayT
MARRNVRQRTFAFRTWGGARAGAGRPPKGDRAGMPHQRRPALRNTHPVHVTLRVSREVGRLRRRRAYQCVSRALVTCIRRHDFRIVHVSIQATHLHLLCEADDARALANGVRGFAISAARGLNRAAHRRGRVFPDRFHAEVITTPRQARHALAYILNNWRKHREDARRTWRVDPYSSAVAFPGWRGRAGRPFAWPRGFQPLPVAFPTVWLLTQGWRRAGPIDLYQVPGRRSAALGLSSEARARSAN